MRARLIILGIAILVVAAVFAPIAEAGFGRG
jgi:hypothetical protein